MKLDVDEACYALQARHIITKGEYPILFPEARYGGSLIAYTAAIFFLFFGISILTLKMSLLVFVAISIYFSYLLGKAYFDEKHGLLMALLMAAPSTSAIIASITFYETAMMLMFSPLILFIINKVRCQEKIYLYSLLGIVSGLAFWCSPSTAPLLFIIATFFILKKNRSLFFKKIFVFIISFIIGSLPLIVYNITHNFSTFFRVGGYGLELDREGLATYPNLWACFLDRILFKISNYPVTFLKAIAVKMKFLSLEKSSFLFLNLPAAFVYTFSLGYFLYSLFNNIRKEYVIKRFLIIGWVALCFLVCLSFPPKETRYVFLYPIILMIVVYFTYHSREYRKNLELLFIILIVLSNIAGYVTITDRKDHILKVDTLASFINSKGISYCYADDQIGYPVMFSSNESIIISPTFKSNIDTESYPQYTEEVNNSRKVCYVIDGRRKSDIETMDKRLSEIGVTYKKEQISKFWVYYDFSEELYSDKLELRKFFI